MQLFCITAVRFDGEQLVKVMLGLVDGDTDTWVRPPSEVDVDEVVAQLDKGQRVQTLFPDDAGGRLPGPEVRAATLPNGREGIAMLGAPVEGKAFGDMPTF